MTKILMEFDKSGSEWVVVAYASGDPRMIDVVENGKDPHLITGALISGADEEFIKAEDKVVGTITDPTTLAKLRGEITVGHGDDVFLPRTMSIRQAAKKANHGLNYDEGYRTFALTNEMDESDAKRIRETYLNEAYPGISAWHQHVRDQLANDRTLTNPFGRMVTLLDAWGPDLFRQGYAFIPQSTSVDVVNRAMCGIWEDNDLDQFELLNHGHDSLLYQAEYRPRLLTSGIKHIIGYMEPEITIEGRPFVIRTSLKIGHDWGEDMVKVDLGGDLEANLEAALCQTSQASN